MRLTISGAQSTGKTSVITELFQDSSINNRFDLRDQTTRNIVRDKLGFGKLPINEQGTDLTQLLICSQHLINYAGGALRDTIYDRCALDGLVYTTYLYDKKQVTKETLRIAESIFDNTKYDIMFYIPPEFPIISDGERSTSQQFRDEICELFDEYIESYNVKIGLLTGSIQDRTKQVIETIKSYDSYQNRIEENTDKVITDLNTRLNNIIGVKNA